MEESVTMCLFNLKVTNGGYTKSQRYSDLLTKYLGLTGCQFFRKGFQFTLKHA
jgi:hypothetical protein